MLVPHLVPWSVVTGRAEAKCPCVSCLSIRDESPTACRRRHERATPPADPSRLRHLHQPRLAQGARHLDHHLGVGSQVVPRFGARLLCPPRAGMTISGTPRPQRPFPDRGTRSPTTRPEMEVPRRRVRRRQGVASLARRQHNDTVSWTSDAHSRGPVPFASDRCRTRNTNRLCAKSSRNAAPVGSPHADTEGARR